MEKRSDCGWWGFPGGRIDFGESVMQAAQRETLEETGLKVQVRKLLGVYSDPKKRTVTFPDCVVHIVDIALLVEVVGGELNMSEESSDLKFFSLSNLPVNVVPPAQAILQDIVDGDDCVIK